MNHPRFQLGNEVESGKSNRKERISRSAPFSLNGKDDWILNLEARASGLLVDGYALIPWEWIRRARQLAFEAQSDPAPKEPVSSCSAS